MRVVMTTWPSMKRVQSVVGPSWVSFCLARCGIWRPFLSIWVVWVSRARCVLRQLGRSIGDDKKRHLPVADLILNDLTQDRQSHDLSVLVRARDRFVDVCFHPLGCVGKKRGTGWTGPKTEGQACPVAGGSAKLRRKLKDFFWASSVWPHLLDRVLRFQGGPVAGLPFMCCPTTFHSRFNVQVFRVLLLRRLWLPVPPHHAFLLVWPSSRRRWPPPCNVRKCGRASTLKFALESVATRVCRGAGGRVSANVLVQGLDIVLPDRADERRIEVIDATLLSPLSKDARCANVDGVALAAAKRQKELVGDQSGAKLVVSPTMNTMLACNGPRSFALYLFSLLERRGGPREEGRSHTKLSGRPNASNLRASGRVPLFLVYKMLFGGYNVPRRWCFFWDTRNFFRGYKKTFLGIQNAFFGKHNPFFRETKVFV